MRINKNNMNMKSFLENTKVSIKSKNIYLGVFIFFSKIYLHNSIFRHRFGANCVSIVY